MSKDTALKRFDSLAPNYDNYAVKIQGYSKTIDRIVELAKPKKTDTVLDLGAGTGAVSFKLAPKVKRVYARDISEPMLQIAKEKALKGNIGNIEFGYGSFSDPKCSEKVDLVVSNLAFHHLFDEEKRVAIKAWYDILKPGGRVIIGDFMWFFDHKKDPEREEKLIRRIVKDLKDPSKNLDEAVEEQKKRDHPSYVYDLKAFFKEAGFKVEGIEEIVPPAMGIIIARKHKQ
jgi:ubiquinone/menaquinone biosynthesis C-methylase UbiE